MRLAGRAVGGFYPAPPEAVSMGLSMLTPPDKPFTVLDPCAGQGAALRQLADGLRCSPENVYAVELDDGRAEQVRAALWSESQILAPASFLGIAAPANSFSYCWCNPPYDSEIGGGARVEYSFTVRATQLLMPHGILQLICPEAQALHYNMSRYLMQWYEDLSMLAFPAEVRQYQEVIVTGRKRRQPVKTEGMYWEDNVSCEPGVYQIPPGTSPRRFEKCDFTPDELARAIQRSPLRKHLEPPEDPPLPEPPLPLSNGHIALLLASGKLDGAVYPKGEPPHVVRGTARKQQYLASQSEEENEETGQVTRKTVFSEKIILTIRAVSETGDIKTFEQE